MEIEKNIQKSLKKNFMYDDLSDSLMVFVDNETGKDNYLLGDFIVSFNEKGIIVGLEIRGISYLLENYEIDPKILDNLENVELKAEMNRNMIYIFLSIESTIDLKPIKQKIPLIIPLHQSFL